MQACKCENIIGPAHRLIKFNLASDVHRHETRFAKHGNFHVSSVRTTRFGLKGLQIEGAKLWENVPNNIKDIKAKKYFNICFKRHLVNSYEH